jgi:hypothetical protein
MHALIATVLVHVSQDGVESLAFFSKREAKLSLINLEKYFNTTVHNVSRVCGKSHGI